MDVTDRLDRAEVVRILTDSGLWETETAAEIGEMIDWQTAKDPKYTEAFTIIAREGRHIDAAIGEYFLYDVGDIEDAPERWAPYIDDEKYGRDIRLSIDRGRAVDLLDDPTGYMAAIGNTSS